MDDDFAGLFTDSIASTVGYNMRRLRKDHGWAAQILADTMTFRSGGREWVTVDDVINWENGMPTDALIILLAAEALDVPLRTLFEPEPGAEPPGCTLLACGPDPQVADADVHQLVQHAHHVLHDRRSDD